MDQPATEMQIAGKMKGHLVFKRPLYQQELKAPTIPTIQTGIVITCALREVQPSWLRIVGLKELKEPADRSAQKKRRVLGKSVRIGRRWNMGSVQ